MGRRGKATVEIYMIPTSESGGFCEVAVTEVDEALGRDLIEAGLNEPAGWRRSYGDCVCSSRSESRSRVSEAAIWPG